MPETKHTEHPAIYRKSAAHAREAGEWEVYKASMKQNTACKEAIESAVREGFDGMHMDGKAVKSVIDAFGIDRVEYVLAATVQLKKWDGRFSHSNKDWASKISIPPDKTPLGYDRRSRFQVDSHPAVLDGFIDLVRKERALLSEKRESVLGQLSALKSSQPERMAPAKKSPEVSL